MHRNHVARSCFCLGVAVLAACFAGGAGIASAQTCPCNGDVDGNGSIDTADVGCMADCVNLNACACCGANCDVDCNGSVDQLDLDAVLCLAGGQPPDVCCGVPLAEACCLENQLCFELLITECFDAGGEPQGVPFCSDVFCPPPPPAPCCLPEGACAELTATDCALNGGSPVAACPSDGRCIPPGDDCWNTECGQTQVDFCLDPIPANFFDPGSQPFDGIIRLGGDGDPLTPDTIIRRLDAAAPRLHMPPDPFIPIELVQLSLVSCEPITVDVGGLPTQWDVQVDLSPTTLPPGSMRITKEHENGGTFHADFLVQPRFTFTRVDDPTQVRVLDTGAVGRPPIQMQSVGNSNWVQDDAGLVTPICAPFINFVPGVQQDTRTLNMWCTPTGHAGPGHLHVTGQICVPCPEGACCNTANGSCTVVQGAVNCNGEYKGDGTDCADTDGDGIADWFESSDCCLPDRDECNTGTDPNNPDTDGDGFSDGFEVAINCDPCVPDTDLDGNGIPDGCETFVKFSQRPKSGGRICINNPARACTVDADCAACVGGPNDGLPCATDADCFPGVCNNTGPCVPDPSTAGEDYPSDIDWVDMFPNWVAADDFVSDGRPIVAVRWWGSNRTPTTDPKVCPVEGAFCGDPTQMCICARRIDGTLNCLQPDTLNCTQPCFSDADCTDGSKCFIDLADVGCCGFNCGEGPTVPKTCNTPGDSPFCPPNPTFQCGPNPGDFCHCAREAPNGIATGGAGVCVDSNDLAVGGLAPCGIGAVRGDAACAAAVPGTKCIYDQCVTWVCAHNCPGLPPSAGAPDDDKGTASGDSAGGTSLYRTDPPAPSMDPDLIRAIWPDTDAAASVRGAPSHEPRDVRFAVATWDQMVAFDQSQTKPAGEVVPMPDAPSPRAVRPDGSSTDAVDTKVKTPNRPPDTSAAAPPLTNSFQGTIDDGTFIPPDTMGAVGQNHIVEILNSGFTVFDRNGGIVAPQITLQAFWSSLGTLPGQPASTPFDPKILYDQYVDRWVVVTDGNPNGRDGTLNNWLLVGISQTPVPTGAWNLYSIKASINDVPAGVNHTSDWCDYPGIGIDPNNVVITNNMFTVASSPSFVHSDVWVINKATMMAGVAALTQGVDYALFHDPCGTGGFTFQPCHTFGQNATSAINHLVDQGWLDVATATRRFLRVKDIVGTGAGAVLNCRGGNDWVEVNGYNFCQANAPQPLCTVPINTNDPRLLNAVCWKGNIYTTQSVGGGAPAHTAPCGLAGATAPTKTEISWYEINPAAAGAFPGGAPTQQGRVADPTLYYYFPSIAVNKDLCVALGFSGSDDNTFASAYYTAHDPAVDPPGAMQPVSLLKAGVDSYWKQFSGTRNRWGDYSATVVDPRDLHTFWTLQEYAEDQNDGLPPPQACMFDAGKWGTWWGSFQCENPIDGWFISFHEHLQPGDPQGPPLALYYCDVKVVDIRDTKLPDCQDHQVYEYVSKLGDCCLVHANVDSRTGLIPAMKNAFYEEECFPYNIDIQAVVGHKFFQDPITLECIEKPTGKSVTDHFWGWHTTINEEGIKSALETSVKMGPLGEWLYGPWNDVTPKCSFPNMAFELLTDQPMATEACCFLTAPCQDLPPIVCCNNGGVPQGPGTSCATTGCPGCGDGICTTPPEDQCNCPTDCGAPPASESGLCTDGVDNDCDGAVDCADSDCATDPACACGDGVCLPPEDQCNCPIDCGVPPASEAGLCADGVDNDCDNTVDCADSDCIGDPACVVCGDGVCTTPPEDQCNCPIDCGVPPLSEAGLCADNIDNDCDGLVDCADGDCCGDPVCCGDGVCCPAENQCNCPIDCGPSPATETGLCTDNLDNDCDGPIDCADSDCLGDPACIVCGDGICTTPPEDQCNCPIDCGVPPASEAGLCADGVDNDCDGTVDCADGDCCGDPVCCGDGVCCPAENPCNCPTDCGPSPATETGLCTDNLDNDCDGPIDCADSDCLGDPACIVCGDGICTTPPEDQCNCPIDCGVPPVSEKGLCADGIDNDCDGAIDCLDNDCAGAPPCCPASGAATPVQIFDSSGVLKNLNANRFLIFRAGTAGQSQAIRVTLKNLKPPFHVWNGLQMWVGPPKQASEAGGSAVPIGGFGNFSAAQLQCTPHCMDWTTQGDIHVFHEAVVPQSNYGIEVVDCNCSLANPNAYSPPLQVPTVLWGDVLEDATIVPPGPPNGTVDILDVVGIVAKFVSAPTAIRKARADLEPNCLDLVINISDALFAIQGFQGLMYPFPPKVVDPCNSPCVHPVP